MLRPDGTLDLSTGYAGSLDPSGWKLVAGPGGAPRFIAAGPGPAAPAAPAVAGDEFWDARFSVPGTDGQVMAVLVVSGQVYIGGFFSVVDKVAANNVARWDGTAWSPLGDGVSGGVSPGVSALAAADGKLYVGGIFANATDSGGPRIVNNIARWDPASSTWSALGTGFNNGVGALAPAGGGTLYAGGGFTSTTGLSPTLANRVAFWNGSAWSALAGGLSGGVSPQVQALAIFRGDLIAAGTFQTATDGAGAHEADYIARWDGVNWSPLGGGLSGGHALDLRGNALVVSGDALYVGGSFALATDGGGPKVVNNLAQWDGTTWSALGSGIPDGVFRPPSVRALAAPNPPELYAGGQFSLAGDKHAAYLGRYAPPTPSPTATPTPSATPTATPIPERLYLPFVRR
jgi:hypothetical protein